LIKSLFLLLIPLICESRVLSATLEENLSSNDIVSRPRLRIHEGEVEGSVAVAKYDDRTHKDGYVYDLIIQFMMAGEM